MKITWSRRRNELSIAVFLLLALCLVFGCRSKSLTNVKQQYFKMSTIFEVTIASDKSEAALAPIWQPVDSLLAFWDQHYSQSNPLSEVHALNHRKSDTVAVSPQLGAMVAEALSYRDSTGGLFDPTILPVKELWGLGEEDTVHHIPSSAQLALAVKRVDGGAIRHNAQFDTLFFENPATQLDAGGFAKGYSLIELGRMLDSCGYHNYLIAAGDIVVRGRRADGRQWNIGIRHPRSNDILATVELDTGAIFTSGDYENFWMDGDRRIHHIFNPKTGCSCTNNQSVTIRSKNPIQAKYLSTGLFCMPADSIRTYAERHGLDCVVVDSSGSIVVSAGWKGKVIFMRDSSRVR